MKKTLIAALALTTLATTPTVATAAKQRAYLAQPGYSAYAQYLPNGAPAYAPRNSVVVDNKIVGVDPDINVRAQLLRDAMVNEY
jgi:ABC-type sugar transport system substrate-binding protein